MMRERRGRLLSCIRRRVARKTYLAVFFLATGRLLFAAVFFLAGAFLVVFFALLVFLAAGLRALLAVFLVFFTITSASFFKWDLVGN